MPACAGIGLRAPHRRAGAIATRRAVALVRSAQRKLLRRRRRARSTRSTRIRARLSAVAARRRPVAWARPIRSDRGHLRQAASALAIALRAERWYPSTCAGARVGGRICNDLLPLPYTEEALRHVVRAHCRGAGLPRPADPDRERLELSAVPAHRRMPEWEFVAGRRGAHGLRDPARRQQHLRHRAQLTASTAAALSATRSRPARSQEIHLAGHSRFESTATPLLDRHARRAGVRGGLGAVWRGAASASARVPTLIEWDTDIPAFAVLRGARPPRPSAARAPDMPSLRSCRAIFSTRSSARARRGAPEALPDECAGEFHRQPALDVSCIWRLVGEDYFRQTAQVPAFASSRSGDSRTWARLCRVSRGAARGDQYRYLADIARLEWLCQERCSAPSTRLDLERLRAVAPRITTRCALSCIRRCAGTNRPTGASHLGGERGERGGAERSISSRATSCADAPRAAHLPRRGAGGEYAFLEAVARGAEFGEAIAGAGACEQEFDAGEALRRFIGAEAIVDFSRAIH